MTTATAAPRIAPLPLDEFRAVERDLGRTASEPPLNVFRTLAHHPALLEAWSALAGMLFTQSLPPRERELVILRSAWRARASYEWAQHAAIGREAGLTDGEIRRIGAGPEAAGWSPADAAHLRAVDELVDLGRISDPTWTALSDRYSAADLLALAMLAGHYLMLAGVLNSAGTPPEPGRPRLGEPPA